MIQNISSVVDFIEGLKECFAMMKIMFHLCLNPQMSKMLKYYTVRMIFTAINKTYNHRFYRFYFK